MACWAPPNARVDCLLKKKKKNTKNASGSRMELNIKIKNHKTHAEDLEVNDFVTGKKTDRSGPEEGYSRALLVRGPEPASPGAAGPRTVHLSRPAEAVPPKTLSGSAALQTPSRSTGSRKQLIMSRQTVSTVFVSISSLFEGGKNTRIFCAIPLQRMALCSSRTDNLKFMSFSSGCQNTRHLNRRPAEVVRAR